MINLRDCTHWKLWWPTLQYVQTIIGLFRLILTNNSIKEKTKLRNDQWQCSIKVTWYRWSQVNFAMPLVRVLVTWYGRISNIINYIVNPRSIWSELGTLEWWKSGLMLDPLFFLISKLNNDCCPLVINLQSWKL